MACSGSCVGKSLLGGGPGAVVETSALPLMRTMTLGQGAPTCRRTLAVSSGKVRRSAKQAAMPAPRNFTAVVGGISEGFSPTMVPEVSSSPLRAQFRSEERGRSAALGFSAGRRLRREAGGGRWNQCCLAQHQEGLSE